MFKPDPDHTAPSTPSAQPADLATEHLEAAIAELGGQIASAMGRWLALIAEFDRRRGYLQYGFPHCAGWLAWQCSLNSRSAREHCRVADRLTGLPLIARALERGELSYSKVRAVTRIATAETEAELLDLARHATAEQLETVVRDHVNISAEAAFNAYEARSLRHRWDENGCLRVEACLPPEQGAAFVRAIEASERFEEPEEGAAKARPNARRADALALMAECVLSDEGRPRRQGESREVIVHVDAGVLAEDSEGRSAIEPGRRIAAESARRFTCDTALVRMLDGPAGPLSVGRSRRTVPPSIRRALASRDGGCRFPGCTNKRFVDAHHVKHWAHGGETSIDNLVTLCTHHHTLVHEGGFGAEFDDAGVLRFRNRRGREIKRRRQSPSKPPPEAPLMPRGLMPLGRGDPLDREHAAWVLMTRSTAGTA